MGQGNEEDAYAPVLVDLGNFSVAFVSVGYLSACVRGGRHEGVFNVCTLF